MRKQIILFFALFCSLSGIIAQNKWSFGPKIGIGFSTVSNTPLTDDGYRTGVVAGVFGEYRVSNFAIEADVLYAEQGLEWGEKTIKDNYLLIPLKAKLYMPYILKGLNVFVGPQLDLCVKRGDWVWWWLTGGGDYKVPYRDELMSIVAGLGYRFDFGLDLTVNYNAGLISNIDNSRSSEKNRVFQITVGYDLHTLFKLCNKRK